MTNLGLSVIVGNQYFTVAVALHETLLVRMAQYLRCNIGSILNEKT